MSLSYQRIILEVDPDRNRIYLGGHRQGARRSTPDLHLLNQRSFRDDSDVQRTNLGLDG